jgi:hypothetical protein
MKLRLQGNSVRLRLTRSEVERLREIGLVEESVDFGADDVLAYRLQTRSEPGPVEAAYRKGTLTVSLSQEVAQTWSVSDEVGLYGQFGALTISVEKDFRCLTRPRDDEHDAFPHPGHTSEM